MPDEAVPDSILLVLPVPFRRGVAGDVLVESQALNGLDRWADNFARVTVACPVDPPVVIARSMSTADYVPQDRLEHRGRIDLVPLPWAYPLGVFVRQYRPTRRLLGELINRCEYLQFAITGEVTGDWAAVAAGVARARGRPYAVWTDNVGHRLVRRAHAEAAGPRRWFQWAKNRLVKAPLMRRGERRLVAGAAVGLFHGRDCYDAYARYSRSPHVTHNVHLRPDDRIGEADLRAKAARLRAGEPLRLGYAGRVTDIKGPLDWVRAMADLRDRGVRFRATWLGDGPLLAEVRAEAGRMGLADRVAFPGFVADRAAVLAAVRDADLFVFCHLTPESPRCLVEALACGAPPVGYESPYPRDLLGGAADRLLVGRGDVTGLADRVAALNRDRAGLAELVERAALLGAEYTGEAVFRHRSDLIKQYGGRRPAAEPARA